MRRIFGLAEGLLASQEGLCSNITYLEVHCGYTRQDGLGSLYKEFGMLTAQQRHIQHNAKYTACNRHTGNL